MINKKLKGVISFETDFDVDVNEAGFITQISAPKMFSSLMKKFDEYVEVNISKRKNEIIN